MKKKTAESIMLCLTTALLVTITIGLCNWIDKNNDGTRSAVNLYVYAMSIVTGATSIVIFIMTLVHVGGEFGR